MDAQCRRTLLGAVHHSCWRAFCTEDGDSSVIAEGMFVRGLADLVLNARARSPRRRPETHASPVERDRDFALTKNGIDSDPD